MKNELTKFLETMLSLSKEVDTVLFDFKKVAGDIIESPIVTLIFSYNQLALETAEARFKDEYEYISWFIFENDFGKAGLTLNDEVIKDIDTFVNFYFN